MNIVFSTQAIRYPLTGIGRYALELARGLRQRGDMGDLRYFDGRGVVGDLPSEDSFRTAPPAPSRALHYAKKAMKKSRWLVSMRQRVEALKKQAAGNPFAGLEDSVFHGPNFDIPEFPGPSVVTFHDLSVFTMPECHPPERVAHLRGAIETALNRATMVMADSDFIREEIIARWSLPPERVGVAKLACGAEFQPRGPAEVAEIMREYGLTYQQYALYAGTIEPRKNLANLIEAYGRLPLAERRRCPLVIAGYKGWNNDDIKRHIARGEEEGWVKPLGYVPMDTLPHLYSGARLFVFPSLYEGFGLPVLEAMASGVPVLTAKAASLPEVGGEAALYTDPADISGMTALIEQGLADGAWRATAIDAGHRQAAGFSWAQCADDAVAIYRQALALNSPIFKA